MNYKNFKLFLLLFVSGVLHGNSIVGYKVQIIHPALTLPAKPLVIKEVIKWHHGKVDSSVSEYYPMRLIVKHFAKGREVICDKEGWILFYDAFILPDSSSYILVKVKTGYESLEIISIELKKKGHGKWRIRNPGCSELYWSKDNEYFITGDSGPWTEHPVLTFYDAKTGKKIREMQFTFWDGYQKYCEKNLILLKSW